MATGSPVNPEVEETATCTWTINDFSNVYKIVNCPPFYAPNSNKKFQLFIEHNKHLFGENHVYISFGHSCAQAELALRYRVSILDANGHKQYTREYNWNYTKVGYVKIQYKFQDSEYALNRTEPDYIWSNYNMTNFVPEDRCNQLLVNGSLKIYCEVDVLKSKPQQPTNLMVKETAALNWTIDGYSSVHGETNSPTFSGPNGEDHFDLALIPDSPSFELCHVFIRLRYTGGQTEMPLQYRVSILDASERKKYTKEYFWNYSQADYVNSEYNVVNYIAQNTSKDEKWAPNDRLRIYCEVDFWKRREPESSSEIDETDKTQDSMNNHQQTLSKNSELMIKSLVQKAILANRFKMFQNSIKPLAPTTSAHKPISHQYFQFESILSQFEKKLQQKLRSTKLSQIILDKLNNSSKEEKNTNYIYNFRNAKLHNVIVNANSNELTFGDVNFNNQIYETDFLDNCRRIYNICGLMFMSVLSFFAVNKSSGKREKLKLAQ